ncbi:hypothetical protein [Reyranella sp.]|jgi:hypothetical protein|uniref:hypothetical protein n=1 Tax=Reyranella sp. TaxID=1929291 RepID=UPI00403572CB
MSDDREPSEREAEEREAVGRRKSLIALVVMVLLLIGGVVLTHELRRTSQLQDCLMTKATNCTRLDDAGPPVRR